MESKSILTCSQFPLVEVDQALVMILSQLSPLSTIRVPLIESCGFVVAESVFSKDPFPTFPASMMDGYALCAPLVAGEYQLQDRVHAGSSASITLLPNCVIYITTGAALPAGCNAVVKIEDTLLIESDTGSMIKIFNSVSPGGNVRQIGDDMKVGELIISKGEIISPAEIGLFATIGITEVFCYTKPIVGVMSTGNELVDPWECPVGSQIRDSNRATLLAAFAEDKFQCIDLGIVRDARSTLKEKMLEGAQKCDVMVTSGGVSMGDADYIKAILQELGQVHFGRINMKPGKPSTFATIPRKGGGCCAFFGLPGNPVSCLVTKGLLIDPALKRMQGMESDVCMHPEIRVCLNQNLKLDPERPEYHRAYVRYDPASSQYHAQSTGVQRSSRLLSMKSANCLLHLPASNQTIVKGSHATGLLVGPLPSPSARNGDPSIHPSASRLDFQTSSAFQESVVAHVVDSKTISTNVDNNKMGFTKLGEPVIVQQVIRVGLLTISDRASAGVYGDESGPEMERLLSEMSNDPSWPLTVKIVARAIVPDDAKKIGETICSWSARDESKDACCPSADVTPVSTVDLILTSGGTGFGPRDITPEAITPHLHRHAPAVAQALISEGLKHTPLAVLSRPVVGTRNETLICTLPGSVKAVRENIAALKPLLPRIINLISSGQCSH